MQICPECGEENPDKFRMCGFCGTELAPAPAQPEAPKMQICPECGEENPEKFRLCGFCGAELAPALAPQEVRKIVTIVFSDLKGSTSLGEKLDPEALREVLRQYFEAMRAVLEEHGGRVEKYIGDAVMAVFGLPRLHEDDALRAVRAAHGMQQALAELNDQLEQRWDVRLTNRTGVNTGEVVVGDQVAGEHLVTGDPVNTAARLEQNAGDFEVLVGEPTYRLVKDAVIVEAVEPLELKGKSEPIPAYRLLGVEERTEGVARRRDSTIVGRETELATLREAVDRAAAERSLQLVTVLADAGVGKSRLAEELYASVKDSATVLHGRCLPYGKGITFWPVIEIVREAAGIQADDPWEAALQKLLTLLGPGHGDTVARVAAAIGLSVEQFPIEELFWGVRKLVEELARRGPLVVTFDDIHWAEPSLLDLIEHLAGTTEDAPVLLLCLARHELLDERPAFRDRLGATVIPLQPLDAAQAGQVVDNLLEGLELADDARNRIVEFADGNPLYVEQILSMLIDSGLVRRDNGGWVAAEGLADLTIPPTIHALLAARLDNLNDRERGVIDPASVIGVVFPQPAVQEIVPDGLRDSVPDALSALTTKQFVHPNPATNEDDDRFRFNHILIRDAAYGGLLKRTRAELHEKFADWAGRVNRELGRETEFEEILGYHLEQAHRNLFELGPLDDHGREIGRKGATLLASAGRRVFARGDFPAGANLLRRAAALLPELDPARLALLPDLGQALLHLGEFEEMEVVLEEAISKAQSIGERRTEMHGRLIRLLLRQYRGEEWSEEAILETAEAITVFEPLEDHGGLTKVWRIIGFAQANLMRWADAAEAFATALEQARIAGDAKQQGQAASGYALALTYGPTPVSEATVRCEEIAEQVSSDRHVQGLVLAYLAHLMAMQGDFARARSLTTQTRALFDELGLQVEAAALSLQAGDSEILAGELESAERELSRGDEALERLGEKYYRSTVACLLANVLCALARNDEAERYCALADELVAPDDVVSQASLRSVRAKLLVRQGQRDQAIALAAEAVELLAASDASLFRINTLLDQAEVLIACERDAEASAVLDEAARLADDKGVVPLAERARTLARGPAAESLASGS